jgi:uncharacterized membrane protein
MIYLIIAGFLVLLFCIVYSHSARIRELKWILDAHNREIKNLKEKLSELKNPTVAGPDVKQPTESEAGQTSGDESGEVRPPVAGTEIPTPASPPPTVPSDVRAPEPNNPAKTTQPIGMMTEQKSHISDRSINWENFLGAKLFAWIGGLTLFLAFAFLLKYSFDHNLISYAMRVAIGFICGAGLVGGGIHLKRKTYEITAQTLCATGIVILYTSSFAANSIYHFFSDAFTFFLVSLITAGAFVLAAGANSKVIAVLGLVGGFLTPFLLPIGQDRPFALFSYVTLLNVGLFCVAYYRRWNFLASLGAIGTVLIQTWWSLEFFRPEKVFIAMAIYLWFNLLFCGAFWYGKKNKSSDGWLAGSAAALPFVTFLFTLFLVFHRQIGMRPGVILSFLLGADLCLLAVVLLEGKLRKFHLVAGGCVFLILSLWIAGRMTPDLLAWALGGSLVFAILHSFLPMVAARVAPSGGAFWQIHLFPLLALLLTLIPIIKDAGGSWIIWPFVLLFNGGILALAVLTASAAAIMAAVIVTGIVLFGWLISEPAGALNVGEMVVLVGAFGIFFSVVATFALNRLRQKMAQTGNRAVEGVPNPSGIPNMDNLFFQIPAFSTVLPYMLLILASSRVEVGNPASIFGLGLFLTAVAICLVRFLKAPVLLPIATGCFFLLEVVVHLEHFNPDNAAVFLGFYIIAAAAFFILPFLYKQDYLKTNLPWGNAALSGPLHFFLIYDVVRKIYPNDFMGLLPAVMAVPFFFGLTTLLNWIPEDSGKRNAILAWFGGSTLFFITLIFPIQFDHQWLTIGWALEGAALIWLFHKIPHPGLRGVGIALLLVSFIRLGMNPAILIDYPYSSWPIFNWYLYAYGIAVFCLMAGGRLLAAPRNKAFGINIPPVLYTLGTILAFLLMNIEIADLFSTGLSLKFQFTGDLARGMTYSIAWALFALCLLVVGIRKTLRPVRLAAIGLIGVTLVKLFFFDLSRLDQLYRIGAFVGVAIVLIAASALYQKWIVRKE